jgi:autotransporter-associated beta strand protein
MPSLGIPNLTSFDGSLANPAVAQAYVGAATPDKLAAALAGLRPLLAELHVIKPPDPCWFCSHGSSVVITVFNPAGDVHWGWFREPTLLFAASDADLGPLGAPVTLAQARLRLTGSFATGRDFIIGHPAFGPDYPGDPTPPSYSEGMDPVPVGGPGWIDTNGHDLKITGTLTSWQRLYKEGEGTLWLTGPNVWHAAPMVLAGVLQGDTGSLATDISNGGRVTFMQMLDADHAHVISGVGSVRKLGPGVLTLRAIQTYTGATDVEEGVLRLTLGDALRASSSVNLAAGTELDARLAYQPWLSNPSGAGRLRFGDSTLTLAIDRDTSFAGVIEGDGELHILGTHTLTLLGENLHSGGTRVAGRLAIGHDQALGREGAPLTLQDSGRLVLLADLDTARQWIAGHAAAAIDTGSHRLTLRAPLTGHALNVTKLGEGELRLTAPADYRGGWIVDAGLLSLAGAGALHPDSSLLLNDARFDLSAADGHRRIRALNGSGEVTLGGNDLIIAGGSGRYAGIIVGSGGLVLDGAHSFQELTGTNTYTGPTTVLAGTLRARPRSLSGQVVNHGHLELFDDGDLNDISAYSGNVTGSGRLVKTGQSVIWLRGQNDYTGGTRIEQGVLMGNTDSLPGDIETHAGLAFYQVQDGTYAGRVSGSGSLLSFGPGALTLTGHNTHTGGTAFSNTLRIQHDHNLGAPASGLLIAGGTLVALDDLTLDRQVALGMAGARFDNNGHDIFIHGRIDGPGGLTKLGAGTLYLVGELDYTGATVIEAGGVVLDGAHAGSVRVLDGAWLQATGSIGGDLALDAGASLSAGNSPGRLVVAGHFIARGEILVEIAGPNHYDEIVAGGMADLAGATLRLVLLAGARPEDAAGLAFLSAAGGILGLEDATYVLDSGLDRYRIARNAHTLYLAPVPEPETWAMLLTGLGLVGLVVRRRAD